MPDQLLCTAFPSRFVPGWQGGDLEDLERFPSADLFEILGESYESDAHFSPYFVVDEGEVSLPDCPRLNQGSHISPSGEIEGFGNVRFSALVVDVDGPGHESSAEWVDSQLALLEGSPLNDTVGWYSTRGGYRLLWALPEPVGPARYLDLLAQLRASLSALGIEADELTDWNRLYRLPNVVRDGVRSDGRMDLSWMSEALDLSTLSSGPSPFAGIGNVRGSLRLTGNIATNRNTTLFRLASAWRRQGFNPEELLRMLQGVNETRCQPPMESDEIQKIADNVSKYDPPEHSVLDGEPPGEGGDEGEGGEDDAPRTVAVPAGVIFTLGSEWEISQVVCRNVEGLENQIVYDRGSLWRYVVDEGRWAKVRESLLFAEVGRLDGELIANGLDRTGAPRATPLKVGARLCNNVVELIQAQRARPGWFDEVPEGILFQSSFIQVTSTGVVEQEHSPSHRQMVRLPFDYQPNSVPVRFLKMLNGCWEDKADRAERIALLQEWIGGALTNQSPKFAKGLILVGDGANGKSTVQEVAKALFPPHTVTAIAPQDFDNEYRRAMLAGSRLNVVSELPEAEILAAESVKAMITGDLMVGRHIRQDPFEFRPQAAHLFSTNELPGVRDMSHGFWRRWIVLDFSRIFKPREQDRSLAQSIVEVEVPQIVSWALDGAVSLLSRGSFAVPVAVDATLSEWRMGADQVSLFVDDLCGKEGGYTVASAIYGGYVDWAKKNGHGALSSTKFGKRLRGLGVKKKKTRRGNEWELVLRPPAHLTVVPAPLHLG